MARQNWKKVTEMSPIALRRMSNAIDKSTKEEFIKLYMSAMKESNKRLGNLEKHGYNEYAYAMARDYLIEIDSPHTRFTYSKSNRENYQNLLVLRRFLSAKSSTIKGQQEIERKRIRTFREKLHLTKNPLQEGYVKNETLKGFLRFLSESPIKFAIQKSGKGVSDELVELLFGNITKNEDGEKELIKLFETYMYEEKNLESSERNLYFGDIMNYLKSNKFPSSINLDKIRNKHGL